MKNVMNKTMAKGGLKGMALALWLTTVLWLAGCTKVTEPAGGEPPLQAQTDTTTRVLEVQVLERQNDTLVTIGSATVAEPQVPAVAEAHHNGLVAWLKAKGVSLWNVLKGWKIETKETSSGIMMLDLLLLLLGSGLVVFFLFCWFRSLLPRHRLRYRGQNKALKYAALTTFCAGCMIYYVGFFTDGTAASPAAYVIRPFVAALGMFVANTSYQEVCEECINSAAYMTAFSLIHLSAIIISAAFVVNFLWKRVKSGVRGLLWGIGAQGDRDLFVFFGFNEPSLLLGKSIKESGRKHHTVYINVQLDGDGDSKEQFSLSQLLGLFPYNRDFLARLRGISYMVKNAGASPAEMDDADENVLDRLNLHFLRRMIRRHGNVNLFFLSDDENTNVKSVLNVTKDKVFRQKNGAVKVFCHARRSPDNLALQGLGHVSVRIIDSSYLAVASLKMLTKEQAERRPPVAAIGDEFLAHPVNFVETDGAGSVTTPFSALLVGFGETGQECLKFIYEFSAFLRKDKGLTGFQAVLVDKEMNRIKGAFKQDVPYFQGKDREGEKLEFLTMDCREVTFWNKVDKLMSDGLNYVVISINDDDAALQLAVRIYDHANRYRKQGFDRFHIFVRLNADDSLLKAQNVVDTYNGMARFDASAAADVEGEPEPGRTTEDVMTIFGYPQQIFSYDVIIDNAIKKLADKFSDSYNKLNPYVEKSKPAKKKHEVNDYLRNQSSRRKEMQNFNNALHVYTKAKLVGGYERMKALAQTDYVLHDKTLLENLAKVEHLRWNASHYMLGYLPMDAETEAKMALQGATCNEQLKMHSCLKDYDDLADYQEFDREVVKTTVALVHGYKA